MSYAYLASTPGLKHNYSLYAVPAGWVVSMAPLWWAIARSEKVKKGTYNNAMPMETWGSLKESLPEQDYKQVIRAVAANNNSHVNLPLFAGALVLGNLVHLPSKTLHLCAGSYLAFRTAYNFAYVMIDDPVYAWTRSILYWGGVVSCLTLYIKSANKWAFIPW